MMMSGPPQPHLLGSAIHSEVLPQAGVSHHAALASMHKRGGASIRRPPVSALADMKWAPLEEVKVGGEGPGAECVLYKNGS